MFPACGTFFIQQHWHIGVLFKGESVKSKKSEDQAKGPAMNEEAIRRIGATLRERYNAIESEPVPDRFQKLLDQLEQQTSVSNDKNDDGASS